MLKGITNMQYEKCTFILRFLKMNFDQFKRTATQKSSSFMNWSHLVFHSPVKNRSRTANRTEHHENHFLCFLVTGSP